MNKSDSIKELAGALVKAQASITAAHKTANNPFFKSKYADLSSIINAVKGPLLEQGITYVQGVQDAEEGVAVETMLIHTSGEWVSSTLRIPASKQDAQGYGSAISYGRRYGLQAMCGVPAEDDDGNAATATVEPPRAKKSYPAPQPTAAPPAASSSSDKAAGAGPRLINADQAIAIEDRCREVGVTVAAFCKQAKIDRISQLQASRYDGALEWLDSKEKVA